MNLVHVLFVYWKTPKINEILTFLPFKKGERGGLVVNASDSGSRGPGFEPHSGQTCCVLEQGTFTPLKVLVIPRKRWLRPNMTEKLFIGTLRINQPTNLSKSVQNMNSIS